MDSIQVWCAHCRAKVMLLLEVAVPHVCPNCRREAWTDRGQYHLSHNDKIFLHSIRVASDE